MIRVPDYDYENADRAARERWDERESLRQENNADVLAMCESPDQTLEGWMTCCQRCFSCWRRKLRFSDPRVDSAFERDQLSPWYAGDAR